MTNTILVTGGCGYLGSQLVAKLSERASSESFNVIAMDVREVPEKTRLPNVTYVTADIRSPDVATIMKEQAVDTIVHLAAVVTPGKDSNRELEYSIDVLGTKNVLTACIAAGVKKFIVTSSGAAYGYHADNPDWLNEEHPLRGNEEFAYSDHKKLVEEMLAEYRQRHPELQQVIFRVCTVLGDKVNNQITNLFTKKRIFAIRGSSTPFVFIWDQDLLNCLSQAIFSDKTGIYNVAGDGALSLQEIAQLLKKPYFSLPALLVKSVLAIFKPLGLTRYGPEQVRFLQYRPVLANDQLKENFGYTPAKTSREVFIYFAKARKLIS